MKDKPTSSSSSVSFASLLFLLFLTLKLCGVISWSWWLVTAPLWGGAAIVLAIAFCVIIFACIKEARS
jgi:hypothetical protein